MPDRGASEEVFRRLSGILSRHVPPLVVTASGPMDYNLAVDRPLLPEPRRYFGGVNVRKIYVAYHLMGVYTDPGLVEAMSPALRRRMQGKSCFNFTSVDEALFGELALLTEKTVTGYPPYLDAFLAARS